MNTPHTPQEKTKVKYFNKLEQIPELPSNERQTLDKVVDTFVFRTNDYYQSLINWDDPNDPIKRLIIPDAKELNDEGQLDASNEHAYTVAKGLEYKYDSTVIMLVNETCGAYPRAPECRRQHRKQAQLIMRCSLFSSLSVQYSFWTKWGYNSRCAVSMVGHRSALLHENLS